MWYGGTRAFFGCAGRGEERIGEKRRGERRRGEESTVQVIEERE